MIVVVCGALANRPANGGGAWTRVSWASGLARLGCEVYFVEQIAPATCIDASGATCDVERSVNLAYFRSVTEAFGLGAFSALVLEGRQRSIGLSWNELLQLADAADLLVNISGHLTLASLKPRFRTRAFIDQDPGYTQFWHAEGRADDRLRDHHVYFTVGENIGHPDCGIPAGNIEWRAIRQPVVLDHWPDGNAAVGLDAPRGLTRHRFTTVASWRGPFGRVTHNGTQYGLKAHEFRKFAALPTRTAETFEIALDIHPADRQDVDRLREHGWTIADPKSVAADPFTFRDYVRRSSAEFSVAQGIYVETRSGWFSDRSVRYLASGKPVLVQDTGFARHYPVGLGLVPFRTLEEAARGAEAIASDYDRHSRAARAIATGFFDSDKILSSMLQSIDLA